MGKNLDEEPAANDARYTILPYDENQLFDYVSA